MTGRRPRILDGLDDDTRSALVIVTRIFAIGGSLAVILVLGVMGRW